MRDGIYKDNILHNALIKKGERVRKNTENTLNRLKRNSPTLHLRQLLVLPKS